MQVQLRPIVRERLCDRIAAANPSILAVCAPAGFGKTTLLHQLFDGRPDVVLCDAHALRDDLDLACRLMPGRAEMLRDGGRSAMDRLAQALEAFSQWRDVTVVFDAAEFIVANAPATQFFTQLLAKRPASVRIVISGRDRARMRLTRFASPHDVLNVRASDLAFDQDELRQTFAGLIDDRNVLERIASLSLGWPVAVFLLRRIASEGRLDPLAADYSEIVFEELHEYLADEVLSAFDERTTRALFVCAAVPHASARDVRDAGEDALDEAALAVLAKESPFLQRDGAWYAVHPLVAALLLEHHEDRRRLLLDHLAAISEREADYERQAELLLATGDRHAAAIALAKHDMLADPVPSMRYRAILMQLDRAVILRHPRLWAVGALARMYCEAVGPLLDEAELLWQTLPLETPLQDRFSVCALRVLLLAYAGRGEDAAVDLERFCSHIPPDALPPLVVFLRSFLAARAGRSAQASLELNRVLPAIRPGDVTAAAAYLTIATDIARVRGDRIETQFLERAAQRAEEATLFNLRALVYAHQLFGGWFAGNTAAAQSAALPLQSYVDAGVRGFAYVCAAARGGDAAPARDDMPEFVVYGDLIAIAGCTEELRRISLARDAYARARDLALPFLETLSALAVALVDERAFDEFLAIAESAARRCESDALHAAVRAVGARERDCGMLQAFATQIAEGGSQVPPIEFSLWSGRVRVDARPVELGGRELELLAAIALRRDGIARARVAEMLWPDLDAPSARNSLSVCLHRLRAHLQRNDAIERDGDAYRLHGNAVVDAWQLDYVMSIVRAKRQLAERERALLERAWSELSADQPACVADWEWYAPTLRRLRESKAEIAYALGTDALAHENAAAALRYAESAMQADPCDEHACELAVRAHLRAGDRAAALRAFRRYRDALRDELGAEPSAALAQLLAP